MFGSFVYISMGVLLMRSAWLIGLLVVVVDVVVVVVVVVGGRVGVPVGSNAIEEGKRAELSVCVDIGDGGGCRT